LENCKNILNDFLKETPFVLIDLLQKGDKNNVILEVFIDRKENFCIDELAVVNKNLWKYIEEKNLEKGIDKIIVSSPGAEESFKYFWQLEKHIGRELEIKMKNGEIITGKFQGISDFEKNEIQIQTKEKKEVKLIKILFGDMTEAKIKLSFKK
jgi:ribosome maturation factor RimP